MAVMICGFPPLYILVKSSTIVGGADFLSDISNVPPNSAVRYAFLSIHSKLYSLSNRLLYFYILYFYSFYSLVCKAVLSCG